VVNFIKSVTYFDAVTKDAHRHINYAIPSPLKKEKQKFDERTIEMGA